MFDPRRTAALALLAAMLVVHAPAYPQEPAQYAPGEVLVRLRPGATAGDRMQVDGELDAEVLRRFDFIGVEQLKLGGGLSVEDAIEQLRANPAVAYAEPNYRVHATLVPDDARFPELWGLCNTGQNGGTPGADIHAVSAWDLFTGDQEVRVGVIDTGIDYNHPDLVENMWTNLPEANGLPGVDDDENGYVDDIHGYDFANRDGNPFDDHYHGTHVAGTIAARGNNGTGVAGVNWRARLVAIKFLDFSGSGWTADAIAAVEYAIAARVRLTSNSWGGDGYSQALLDAIMAAGAAGQLFIAAAGNNALDIDQHPFYPAAYSSAFVISVAATGRNDSLATFSNRGPTSVDLAAPGVDILSTMPGGTYGLLSGTSMATPHVAGVAALAWGRFPSLGPLEMRSLLLASVDATPALLGKVATGGRLNAMAAIRGQDSIPPARIDDLAAVEPGSNTMTLAWSATGDDGFGGRAKRVEIRRATAPIGEAEFPGATLAGSPVPAASGSLERFEVTGLVPSTTYYFAVKAFDEYENASPVSNNAVAATLGIPHVQALPASLVVSALPGTTHTEILTVSNVGEGRLDFTLPQPASPAAVSTPDLFQPLAKGEPDTREGTLAAQGEGGADGYGYRWTDSDDPQGPSFEWVDITGPGTPVPLAGDDASSPPASMGMHFPFYGDLFDSVRVCTNGFLSFTDGSAPFANQPLPNAGGVANMIAPLWDDLSFGAAQRAYTYNDGARFVVSWVAVPRYPHGGPYTFQVLLYPSGEILFQYLSLAPPTNSATAGIQNAAKTSGLSVAFNTTYLRDSLAVRIRPPLPPWLSAAPLSGRIPAGQSMEIELHFSATAGLCGDLSGQIPIFSNDPDVRELVVPVSYLVTQAPELALSRLTIEFGSVTTGHARPETLVVENRGCEPLAVDLNLSGVGFTADASGFTLGVGQTRAIEVRFSPESPGEHAGALTVRSDDPDESEVVVPLHGQAVLPPDIVVRPDSLNATAIAGAFAFRTLTVHNAGGASLSWQISSVSPLAPSGEAALAARADLPVSDALPTWLTASPASGIAGGGETDSVSISFRSSGLAGGDYEAILVVSSNDPDLPFAKRPAYFHVVAIPDIAGPASLDFDSLVVGQDRSLTALLLNEGSDVLYVSSGTVTGTAFSLTGGGFPLSLPPGGGKTLTVRFAPTEPCSPCTGDLTLVSNDPDEGEFHVALSGVALALPEIEVARDTLRAVLASTLGPSAAFRSRRLQVFNAGASKLEIAVWGFLADPPAGPAPAAAEGGRRPPASPAKCQDQAAPVPRDSDSEQAPADGTVIQARGGPDAFGNVFVAGDDIGGPRFEWVDIIGAEPPLPLVGDEAIAVGVPLGFDFPFYGNRFDKVNVHVNGWLSFTHTATTAYANERLPDARPYVPENLLAVFWDNLYFGSTPRAHVYRDGSRFIVSWVGVSRWPTGGPYTFQAILYPNGTIVYQYLDMGSVLNSATVGIQNATKDDGLTVVDDADYVDDSLAIEIRPTAPWLSLSPSSATVPAGDSLEIQVGFHVPAGMTDGDYQGVVRVGSNDPRNPGIEIPAVLHVGVVPAAFHLDLEHHIPNPPGSLVTGRVTFEPPCAPLPIDVSTVFVGDGLAPAPGSAVIYEDCGAVLGFDRMSLFGLLEQGPGFPLQLIGELEGVSWFSGRDTVRMLSPQLRLPSRRFDGGSTVTLDWTDAPESPPSLYDLWYSADGGQTWAQMAMGVPERQYVWIAPRTGTKTGVIELIAHAVSDGSFVGAGFSDFFRVTPNVTGVADSLAPTEFGLRLAGANPALGSARLELALATRGEVEALVYDVRGAVVKRIASGTHDAGRLELDWDGTDGDGRDVGAGVYFVRVRAGAHRSALKIVLSR